MKVNRQLCAWSKFIWGRAQSGGVCGTFHLIVAVGHIGAEEKKGS